VVLTTKHKDPYGITKSIIIQCYDIVKFVRFYTTKNILTHVHFRFTLLILMPENARGRPKDVARSAGFNN